MQVNVNSMHDPHEGLPGDKEAKFLELQRIVHTYARV